MSRVNNFHCTIPEFFKGKKLLITGGSGFLGKVLIEKLLRSCPEIGNIYILLRLNQYNQSKKTLENRLQQITNNILFSKLKEEHEKNLEKLIPIEGDVKKLALGLKEEDRQKIIENVSIIYHVAASVRFDEPLKDAILMNTRGTREVCKLVLDLKKVDAFLYVSTAYCQLDKSIIEEKMYDNHKDWQEIIEIAENTETYQMQIVSRKMMGEFPNTYTYTKALAESAIKELCESKVPTIVIRPTIVISMYKEPMPGWNDNMNGPVGLIAARAKGILRCNYVNFDSKIDMVTVDHAINAMIKATWLQQMLRENAISVYNCSGKGNSIVKIATICNVGEVVVREVTPRTIWYPNFASTSSKFIYLVNIYLFHLIPAVIADTFLKFLDKPQRLLKIQKKIFIAMGCLEYFMQNQWTFCNERNYGLDDYLQESDRKIFTFDLENIDPLEYFITAARVGLGLILKEDLSDIKKNKKTMIRMGYIHKMVKITFWTLVGATVFKYLMSFF